MKHLYCNHCKLTINHGSSKHEATKLHHSEEVKSYTICRTVWKSFSPARVWNCQEQYPSLAKKQGKGIHELMATGRQKKLSEELMCQWIGEAWRDIPREMITSSFLKCGITNSLDCSEDDFVFNSSSDDESFVEDEALVDELFASDSESEDFYRF